MSTIPTQRIYEGYLCLRVFFVRRVGYFQYCGMEGGTPCRYRQSMRLKEYNMRLKQHAA